MNGYELVDVDRFRSGAVIEDRTGCWVWRRKVDRYGYGRHEIRRDGVYYRFLAHRLAYRLWVGEIAPDLQIDHTCHGADLSCVGGVGCFHRRCINPDHLEAVTPSENTRRGRGIGLGARRRRVVKQSGTELAVCRNGHLMTPENSKPHSGWPGSFACVQCARDRQQRRQRRNRAA